MEVITLLAYFNTSHVTVYLFWWIHYRVQIIFQYISCYCLSLNTSSVLIPFLISIHLMLLFIIEPLLRMCMYMYFNTSHVTVYHYPGFFCSALRKFQYISCYCLSIRITIPFYSTKISIHLMLLFILVLQKPLYQICIISIHLMLLFIFYTLLIIHIL